jgi:hypothetical protein
MLLGSMGLSGVHARLKPRRGHKRALGAVKHSMISAISHVLSTGETYCDLGACYFTTRDPERQTKRLVNSSNASDITSRSPRRPRHLSELFLSGTTGNTTPAQVEGEGSSAVGIRPL